MNEKFLIGIAEDEKVFLKDQDFGRLIPVFITNRIQNNFTNNLTVNALKNNYNALVINSDELSIDIKNNFSTLNNKNLRDVIDVLDIDINSIENINLKISVIKEASRAILSILDLGSQLISINLSQRERKILFNIAHLIVASNESFLTFISALKNNYVIAKLIDKLDEEVKDSLKDNINSIHEFKNIKSYNTNTIKSLIPKLEELEKFMPTNSDFKKFSLMDELKNKKLIIVDNSSTSYIQKSIINLILFMRLKIATEIKFLNSSIDKENIIFRIDNFDNIDENIKNILLNIFQCGGACPYHIKLITSSKDEFKNIEFLNYYKIEIKNNDDATLRTVGNFELINLDFKLIN